MRPWRSVLVLSFFLSLVAAGGAWAQGFGINKVHYQTLDWRVLETPHLRLHYYAEEESLARRLAPLAESTCVEFDRRFRMGWKRKIPFLLYSAHHVFQQTNATPSILGEGTGGLTELIKGRVLLPHNGSWARLAWVTRHELTHAYMLEKFAQVQRAHKRPQSWLPPLWYIEGLAEYCGTTWDADAEGLLRDMVCSNLAYPMTRSEPIYGSVEMYKEGQSFMLWLAERYGDDGVFDLLDNVWRADDFETCVRLTYGRSLADLDDEWFRSIRRRYWPVLETAKRPAEVGHRLTAGSRFNLGPRALAAVSDSDTTVRFAYFSVRDGQVVLLVHEPRAGKRPRSRRLLAGGGSAKFESFHLFQNRPAVSRTSELVALSSKVGGRDALYLVDGGSGRVTHRFEFPGLVAILDPAIEPGDSAVVFSAQADDGNSDLYRVTWPGDTAQLERLTYDPYDDLEPDVSPDGRWIAWSSDRGDHGGRHALFRMPTAGGAIEAVSAPPAGEDRQPVHSPDGRWLLFRSTRGGTSDLWVRTSEPSREARRLTRMIGPVSDPDWTRDGRRALCAVQDRVTFHVYLIGCAPESLVAEPEMPAPPVATLPAQLHEDPAQPYERRLSLDLIQNGFVLDPGAATGGAGQVAFSDVLGNEQYVLSLANDSDRFGDFWDGWQGGLNYFNQGQRLNYGLGVFRLTQLYDPELDIIRREKRVGVLAVASYPFNKFERVEASVVARHVTDHVLRDFSVHTVDLVSNYLTYVRDTGRWTYDGPAGGMRLNLTAGYTRDISTGLSDYASLFGEVRHYRTVLPRIVSATRVQGLSNLGPDAARSFVGGPSRLRGFDRSALTGFHTVVVQQEFRFPLLSSLVLAVPAPWRFPTVSGAGFVDGAWAWTDGEQRQLGSVGYGVWILGGFYPALRWNWAFRTDDFRSWERRPVQQFAIVFNY